MLNTIRRVLVHIWQNRYSRSPNNDHNFDLKALNQQKVLAFKFIDLNTW